MKWEKTHFSQKLGGAGYIPEHTGYVKFSMQIAEIDSINYLFCILFHRTALHLAVFLSSFEITKFLIDSDIAKDTLDIADTFGK